MIVATFALSLFYLCTVYYATASTVPSAMSHFFEKLQTRVEKCNSLLCIGLDPHVSQLSVKTAEEAAAFCIKIIEQTHPYAAAFKPNSAFFEAFGAKGFEALISVMKSIPADIPIILDNKRGDIDTTAQAYASAAYDVFDATAVTLSPYMGWDSVQPFVTGKYANKAAFVLCKTSNPSSNDLQNRKLTTGETLFESVAQLCNSWNDKQKQSTGSPCVGLVAGATDIPALKAVRAAAPDVWILCPGVGAQGGDAQVIPYRNCIIS
jgi:uridine monophosphate synthetase